MGRGNWIPGKPHRTKAYVYVDASDYVSELDEEANEVRAHDRYEDFKAALKAALPRTFTWLSNLVLPMEDRAALGPDDTCWAYNRHFLLVMDWRSEQHHLGVGLIQRENTSDRVAENQLQPLADKIFDKLQQGNWPLRVRRGSFTSSPRPLATPVPARTHRAKTLQRHYTVVGYYPESGQEYCDHLQAKDEYDAYTQASANVTVISVFEGVHEDLTCSVFFKRSELNAVRRRSRGKGKKKSSSR